MPSGAGLKTHRCASVVALALLLSSAPSLEALVHDHRKLNLPLRAALDATLTDPDLPRSDTDAQLLDASAHRLAKRFEQALAAHLHARPKASAARRDALAAIGRGHLTELREALASRTRPGFERARKLVHVIDLDFDDLLMLR